MSISAISNTANKQVLFSHKKSNQSFHGVYYKGLTLEQAKELYEDGPHIYRIFKKLGPALDEKFKKDYNVSIYISNDFFRSTYIDLIPNNFEKIVKHILKNNDKIFHFPKKMIDSLEMVDSHIYNKWLHYTDINIFNGPFNKDTLEKEVLKNTRKIDLNKAIREAYDGNIF